MYRLTVAILAAFDALVAAAVGLVAILAPLTLIWVVQFGGDWAALWPSTAAIWQFGHLVPLAITLPDEYLAVTGISADAASFTLSLAPLAFTAFTAIFAARSGRRAARADAWGSGVLSGAVVFAAIAWAVWFTSGSAVAQVTPWHAIALPTLVFALPSLAAAVALEWKEGGGLIARIADRFEAIEGGWGTLPYATARGIGIVAMGLVGSGAVVTALAIVLHADQAVALYEASNLDAAGATVMTLAQLAYLPTLVVWGLSFVAGPGFALGAGTAVSPAATQLGVVPPFPVLGAVPQSTGSWMLLLALLPVAAGVLGGLRTRRHFAAHGDPGPWPLRAGAAALIALVAAGFAALLAALASGSLGPGVLAVVGPEPGPVALAVGLEVALGAGIVLLAPRSNADLEHPLASGEEFSRSEDAFGAGGPLLAGSPRFERGAGADADAFATLDLTAESVGLGEAEPAAAPPTDEGPDGEETLDLGPRGPRLD
ncbi:DUF6350 family protein [Microbacterium fluvii]|uniref:DUF6350 family protein n=1 Tax=Microbacterium fluvii TaxID=415215 RepID=A0ABW2HDZ0_9MICO|nr:DUF6350 family protein [Microbacterium fluvii]MCU4671305.1 DUF6350 family protein [Microbacterium fluvii]